MFLIGHIIFATISILFSITALIKPSNTKLKTTKFLTFGTVVSGIVLTAVEPKLLTQNCIEGLIYLTFVAISLKYSAYRLSIDP